MTYYLYPVLQVPAESLVIVLLLGSALLALWTLARFDRFGPRTLGGAMVAGCAGLILLVALGNVVEGVASAGIPDGRLVIAMGVVVPVFTYFFLASGWLMRAVRDLFAGML